MDERISLDNPIFKLEPALRFSETMGVSRDLWIDMWRRYMILEYSKLDLKEWFELKTKRPISYKTIDRWVTRQELYNDAQLALKQGATIVTIRYFRRNQEEARKVGHLSEESIMDILVPEQNAIV